MIKLTLPGPVPSKKNSRQNINIKGRLISVPNKKYKDWHQRAGNELIIAGVPRDKIRADRVVLEFYLADNRGRDLTNMTESVMDLLVDKEVLEDDCWQCVPRISIEAVEISRNDPRVVVTIECDKSDIA